MYEVRNEEGRLLSKHMVLNAAKAHAESAAKSFGKPFSIYKVECIWTTQTLEEAIKS